MTIEAVASFSIRSTEIGATNLVRLVTGEYTALSVIANFQDAARLGLVKAGDGNYVRPPLMPSPASATTQSKCDMHVALAMLPLGGR